MSASFETLARLEESSPLFADARRAQTFIDNAIHLLPRESLPAPVRSALEVASRYREGAATDTELEKARVAAWDSLGDRSLEIDRPDVAAVRAAICALYPTIDDVYETLHAFTDFAMRAGVADSELAKVMSTAYDDAA